MRYERKYIQYNDLVFDGYGMLGEYDASSVSFKVTTHARSFGHGSYAPFKSPNAFVEESSVSLTLWLKEKKLPCDVRPFYRSFVIEQLSKHGKLWAVQDNTLVWAYATVQSYSEMVEHANGKLGIDVDFLLYEGVWHKADKQKTFLHPYDLCTFMDCFDYKEYQPCRDADIMACGSCGEIDVPAQSGSGSLVTLEIEDRHDAIGALSADIDPVQSFNGYDNPWAGGAGKNLLKNVATTQTRNGVTFTFNADGSVRVNGTATSNAAVVLCDMKDFLTEAGTYTLSGCPSGGGSNKFKIECRVNSSNVWYGDDGSGVQINYVVNQNINQIRIIVYSGFTANNLIFYPMLEKGSTKTAFEPYTNICPITGFDSVKVWRSGKNLLPPYSTSGETSTSNGITFTYNSNGSITASGTATANAFTVSPRGFRLPPGTYKKNAYDSTKKVGLLVQKKVTSSNWVTVGVTASDTFTLTEEDAQYELAVRIRVESGATLNSYNYTPIIRLPDTTDASELYNGNTYSVSFGSAGTVYGGTLDVVSGQLTVTHKIISENDFYAVSSGTSGGGLHYANVNPSGYPAATSSNSLSNMLVNNQSGWGSTTPCYTTNTSGNPVRVYGVFTTLAEFKTAYEGLQIVYELATPLTYQILPADVNLILGTNNIWANTGDIDVETTGYHRDLYDGCFTEIPKPENNRYCCECNCDEVTQDMALCYHLEDLQDVYKECSNAGFRVIYDCKAAERFFNILGQRICTDNCSNGTLAGRIYSETDIPTTGVTITLVGKMHNPYVEINGNGNWIAGDYDGRLKIEPNGDVYYENGCKCDEPLPPDIWQKPSDMNYGWTVLPRYNRVVVNLGACCGKACAYFNIDNLTI